MRNAEKRFKEGIADARGASTLFSYLTSQLGNAVSVDDLLRSQVVNAVSCFDRLIHDLIRIGILQIYSGSRAPTAKYINDTITIGAHANIMRADSHESGTIFEQEIIRKLKIISYQEPTKVADGLSYVWSEAHKWQKIASAMGLDQHFVTTRLRLIADRRNAIVHEADRDPVTHSKLAIARQETEDITTFLDKCGTAIVDLVV